VLRAPTLAAASLLTVLAAAVGIGLGALGGTPDPNAVSSPAPTIEVAPRTEVPDVRGMSAPQARALLERLGLRFARATAAEGTPGRVLGTLPSVGRSVASGTAVTLIVGVEAERLVAGLVSSLSSEDASASP
jgi:beta-lactam-binding protein with PASTA domain